jgi:hypothetical protein
MNLKKILILPVGFILIHILYIGCCKCMEGNFHREASSLRVYEFSHSNLDKQDTVKVIDTLFSFLTVNYTLVAKNKANPFSQLVNAAYATTCNCSNYSDSGFKYKVDSIVINSNDIFKGIPAGQNIGSYFTAAYNNYNTVATTVSYITVPQLVDSINVNRRYDNFNLFTRPGNMTGKTHRLKYILYSNGKSYEVVGTKIIAWQ